LDGGVSPYNKIIKFAGELDDIFQIASKNGNISGKGISYAALKAPYDFQIY
jgi:hypothetical protein